MGYRSDVRLAFYCETDDKDYPELEAWVRDNMKPEFQYMQEFDSVGYKGFLFSWDFIKWYEDRNDYEHVTCVMNAINNFLSKYDEGFVDGKTPNFRLEYIRLGEEERDIHRIESDNAVGLLMVKTSIELCI